MNNLLHKLTTDVKVLSKEEIEIYTKRLSVVGYVVISGVIRGGG